MGIDLFIDRGEVDKDKTWKGGKRFNEEILVVFYEERIWVVEGHT